MVNVWVLRTQNPVLSFIFNILDKEWSMVISSADIQPLLSCYLSCPPSEHFEPKACCETSSCTAGTKPGCSEHSALIRGNQAGERRPRYASVGKERMRTGEIKDEDEDVEALRQVWDGTERHLSLDCFSISLTSHIQTYRFVSVLSFLLSSCKKGFVQRRWDLPSCLIFLSL